MKPSPDRIQELMEAFASDITNMPPPLSHVNQRDRCNELCHLMQAIGLQISHNFRSVVPKKTECRFGN
jgi:hypothetical protein